MVSTEKLARYDLALFFFLALGCSEHCKSQTLTKRWYASQLQDVGGIAGLARPVTSRDWAIVTSSGFFVSLEWITVGASGKALFRPQRVIETPLHGVTYSSGGPGSTQPDVWIVGAMGAVRRSDREMFPPVWGVEPVPTMANLNAVSSVLPSLNELWMVGDVGTIVHYDGANSTVETVGDQHLLSVWANEHEVWAVGDGQDVVFHYIDGLWRREPLAIGAELVAVAGTGRGDVWFVGKKGAVVRWDGVRFISMSRPDVTADLEAVTVGVEGAWIAGADGTLLLWPPDDDAPRLVKTETAPSANWVAVASAPTRTSPSLDSVTLAAFDGTVALYEMPEQMWDLCE